MLQQPLNQVTPITKNNKKFTEKHVKPFHDKTEKQKSFTENYFARPEVTLHIQDGSAGTGKTSNALHIGLRELASGNVQRIIIINSTVQGRNQGFLPGTQQEKEYPFESKYISMVNEMVTGDFSYGDLKDSGKIVFLSTSFLRGDTFKDAFVIVDEFQNMNYQELFSTTLTRLGTGSKVILCGDRKQCDLNAKNDRSGFGRVMKVLGFMEDHQICKTNYTPDDIVRSDFVKQLLIAEEKAEEFFAEDAEEKKMSLDDYFRKYVE